MASFKKIIESLEKELTAWIEDPSRNENSNLQPIRLRLTLQFQIVSNPDPLALHPSDIRVVEATSSIHEGTQNASPNTTHSLEIEYSANAKRLERLSPIAALPDTLVEPQDSGEGPTDEVMVELTQLLGAPGFDSSARAAVVREVLQGLSRVQVLQAAHNLDGAPHPELKGDVRRAWHRLAGVIRSRSFNTIDEGGQVVRRLFERYPPAQVLRWISERWQSQEKW